MKIVNPIFRTKEIYQTIDSIFEFKNYSFSSFTESDKRYLAGKLLRIDNSNDWLDTLSINSINDKIEHIMNCSSQEAKNDLSESLQSIIVKHYEETIEKLVQERFEERIKRK